jgi:hypothetical protein
MPRSSDDNHRVLSFRLHRAKVRKTAKWREPIHDDDPNILLSLGKFERDDREDDFRHRMIVNGLAFVVSLALIVIGVWLADNVSDQHTLVR